MNDDEPISDLPAATDATGDIESRQDEVLRQLNELLQRLEQTIHQAQAERRPAIKRPAA